MSVSPSRSMAVHSAPLLSRTPCSLSSHVCIAASVMSECVRRWAASAVSCSGVNLQGRWPRDRLAAVSPVVRRRISAL
ncbi:hypothetical protein J2848_006962 [Azospirillum lipoferum]|nr:hypothetical protein [Azospirillum lipoferum]